MDTMVISALLRDTLTVAIKLSAPMLVLCMAIGVIVAIFQAVTQIHEQTLGFILKLVIIIAVLLVGGTWMLTMLQDYTKEVFLIIGS